MGKFCKQDFKYAVGENIRNVTIVERFREGKNDTKTYKYKCNVCGHEDFYKETKMDRALSGNSKLCHACMNKKVVVGINDIPTTDPWMVKYFVGGYEEAKKYVSGSNKKINPICPYCNRIKEKAVQIFTIKKYGGISCPCGDTMSYPEKFMYSCLEQLGLEFEKEYSPEWINPFRYDFYIPSKNMIIEMDGGLGHGRKAYGVSAEESAKRDDIKDEQAKNNGIMVYRVNSIKSDGEYISNEIKNSGVFTERELNKIDMDKANEFALGNLYKEICEFYNNNLKLTTTEIGKVFHMSKISIRKILKKGAKVGWCEYNAEKASRSVILSNAEKAKGRGYKNIVISKNGKDLRKYSSISDIIKNSEKDLGVKFTRSRIREVLTGKYKDTKGYVFRIGSEEE